jgi:hypothetical protein
MWELTSLLVDVNYLSNLVHGRPFLSEVFEDTIATAGLRQSRQDDLQLAKYSARAEYIKLVLPIAGLDQEDIVDDRDVQVIAMDEILLLYKCSRHGSRTTTTSYSGWAAQSRLLARNFIATGNYYSICFLQDCLLIYLAVDLISRNKISTWV